MVRRVDGLRFDAINLVLADLDATTEFLRGLGVGLEDVPPQWAPHHRAVSVDGTGFSADLDSSPFASYWGGLADGFTGVVVNLRTDDRAGVDAAHAAALRLGATELRAPYDAFWGARCAFVEGPGPIVVGLMSPIDPSQGEPPPPVSAFS